MQKIFRYILIFTVCLMLHPVSFTHANTTEEEDTEGSDRQPGDGTSTEEYSDEQTEEITEEPAYEYIPPRNQQPEYEPTTEAPYQYFEAPTEEYYEPVEPSMEETVEAPTEEVTEEVTEEIKEEPVPEPTEEVFIEPETVEEPREVMINQAESADFSIRGKVVSDNEGIEGVSVNLTGDKEDSVETDEDGSFIFPEVASGEYELQVETPEGYSAEEDTFPVVIEDRGKRGIVFVMEEAPVTEEVEALETDEQAAGQEEDGMFDGNIAIIVLGIVLLFLGLIIFLARARKE